GLSQPVATPLRISHGKSEAKPAAAIMAPRIGHRRGSTRISAMAPTGTADATAVSFAPQAAPSARPRMAAHAKSRRIDPSVASAKPARTSSATVISLYAIDPVTIVHG